MDDPIVKRRTRLDRERVIGAGVLLLVVGAWSYLGYVRPIAGVVLDPPEVFAANAGESVLPAGVLGVIETLRDRGVESYSMTPLLRGDAHKTQRLTEGAWPIRPVSSAAVVVGLADEAAPAPGCRLVHRNDILIVHDCP